MSMEKVVAEIISQAEKEAQGIIAQGKEEETRIKSEAEKEAKKVHQKTVKKTGEMIGEFRRKELSSSQIQLKKNLLEAKKAIVDQVVESVRRKILSMPQSEREKATKSIVKKALKEMPDAKYFYCSKNDRGLVAKNFPNLKFAETIDTIGGIVLENKEQTIRVNYTFEVMLDMVKEENMNEFSKNLFG